VRFDANVLIDPFVVGTIARFEVTVASSALRVAANG